jgi:hypothetical protein
MNGVLRANIRKHLGGLITFRQRYRPFDPQPELLGGSQ